MASEPVLTAREGGCQEASISSRDYYIPCDAPAVRVIEQRDGDVLRMCAHCARHNLEDRGGQDLGMYEGPTG